MLPISGAMRAALTSPAPVFDFGVDLLDDQDRPVEDISADVLAVSVERSMYADVHGSCDLTLTRDLAWGVDRVRPWISVWDGHSYDVETTTVRRRNPDGANLIPPFTEWELIPGAGQAYVDDAGVLHLADGGMARGWARLDGRPWIAAADLSSTEPSPQYAPDAGLLWNTHYFAADRTTLVMNTAGYTTNGRAGTYSADGQWHRHSWDAGAAYSGPDVVWLRLQMQAGSGNYPSPSYSVRNPSVRVDSSAYSPYYVSETTTTRTPQTHRWDLGVFLLTSPETVAGESPRVRDVSGVDKLWLLQREVGDTYVIAAGTSYLDAIRTVLTDAGVTGGLLLDGDRQGTTLAEAAVWILTDQPTSWLRVVNDLLGMIGYRGLWVDEAGRFRSEPYRPPTVRGSSWTFDTTDVLAGIVGEDRTLSADVYATPNLWRFVRKMDTRPTEGAGIYTVDRSEAEPFVRRKVLFVDAADQAALVTEGDRVVAEDTQNTRVVTFDASALPLTHFDVVTIRDPDLGVSARAQVRRWTITDDGQMQIEAEVLNG